MGNSYYNAEQSADAELRNKRKREELKEEIEMLEETIRSSIEDPLKDGLTEEQLFLTNYYGLNLQDVSNKQFDLSNVSQIEYIKSNISREQLETNRYNELIDIYSAMEEFDGEKVNKFKDPFHKDIREWDDYTRDFEQDSLIVKKMRNLQMLNRTAHKYEFLFKSILYRKYPEINRDCIESDKKRIKYNVEEMFSSIENDSKRATQFLEKRLSAEQVRKIKKDKVIKYCIDASKWMFNQKIKYLQEVLHDLQNTNGVYKYGIKENSFVFDVPEYGQFCVHMGKNNTQKVEELRKLYDVKDYEGAYLGNVYILSKADPELLKNVDMSQLSEENKQRYEIAKSRDIVKTQQKTGDIEQIIENLNEERKKLKNQVTEIEEKVTSSASESTEPSSEVIEDIKKLHGVVQEQNKQGKKARKMIKTYREDKITTNQPLKQEKKTKDRKTEELEQ